MVKGTVMSFVAVSPIVVLTFFCFIGGREAFFVLLLDLFGRGSMFVRESILGLWVGAVGRAI